MDLYHKTTIDLNRAYYSSIISVFSPVRRRRPYSPDLCTGLENQDKLLQRALQLSSN